MTDYACIGTSEWLRPTWGGGGELDWHAAATRAGNAVLAAAPTKLVFVGGLEYNTALAGARELPVVLIKPKQLAYVVHDYAGNW